MTLVFGGKIMLAASIKPKHIIRLMLSVLLLGISLNIGAMPSPQAIVAPSQTNSEQDHYRQAAQYSEANGGRAMVVVKSGQVVFEDYADGVNPERGRFKFSCIDSELGSVFPQLLSIIYIYLHKIPKPSIVTPKTLGVDDFCFRKSQTYRCHHIGFGIEQLQLY
jgi:hypothetical protein